MENMEAVETKETQTQETDPQETEDLNLDDLDISELEGNLFQEEETTTEPTETKEETEKEVPSIAEDEFIEVDGEKIPLKDAILAFKNKNEWQKSNTQKAQEIAEEKRRLEEEQRQIEEERQRINLLMQQQPQQPAQPEQPNTSLKELGIDLEDVDDPALRVVLEKLQSQEQKFNQWQQQMEEQRFLEQSQRQHEKLKQTFPDYNPDMVEQAILKGRDPFEDTYKALKYDAIIKGDPEQLKSMIPKQVIDEIKKDARKQLIEDLRKREKKLKSVSTTTPAGQALPRMPEHKPEDYNEAKQDVLKAIAEEGISLFE